MLSRVHVVRASVLTHGGWYEQRWRVVEQDGSLCTNWLGTRYEADDPEGPLDRGGFEHQRDAMAFGLGVDHERAWHGLLAESITDIEAERAKLDPVAIPELDALEDSPDLCLSALAEAVWSADAAE